LKRLTITGSAGHRHLGRATRAFATAEGGSSARTRPTSVPVPVPVAQFWGLTLYSENTRRPYDNGQPDLRDVNLDSRGTLQRNADDSIHLYVGPAAPPGLESNWMKTVNQDGRFVIFRLYAPTEPFFDRSWALPDFELVTP
jgi:hypothetical protein